MSTTPRPLVSQPTRTVPATVLGVVLLLFGGLGAWLVGSLVFTGSWPSAAADTVVAIGDTRFDAPATGAAAGALAALGLAALVAALWPGRASRRPILVDDVPGDTAISRRDLARHLRLRSEQVDGVHSVRARVTARHADVAIRTVVDDPDPVLARARSAVEQATSKLQPATPLRTRVRVQRSS